jgi:hypothetical protein
MNQGNWKEAEELGTEVIVLRKRVLGQELPDTLISMRNLALTFWTSGSGRQLKSWGCRCWK